jgi:Protein of unknown function (DUF732)
VLVSNSKMAVLPFRPVVAAAAAVLAAAGIAHADTGDDQFLGLLSNDGLSAGPPEQMIAIAHRRCDANGLSRADWFTLRYLGRPSPFVVAVSKINVNLQSQGLTPDQAVQFMRDAVAVYCQGTNG